MSRPDMIKDYQGLAGWSDVGAPVVKSGQLIETNAGWRTLRPVINAEKCVFCLQCYLLCPDGTLVKDSGKLEVDYDYCKGCGICARECGFGAITMEPEED
ncbi:MAG: 4Fe-4S binding protein [Deltaproteobacteria bacterium]|jgi:pyruvate ferredoxin oxidoreductase delta subunit|nr:4Fe-4S binding protein [Deltaproteobacteria bacterium]